MLAEAYETKRWTRAEYEKLIQDGYIAPDERVELLDGEIIAMTPQKSLHATACRRANEALRTVFQSGHDVRPQLPLALGPFSMPEPDLAVVTGSFDDYTQHHPTTAVLVVEISDSTLRLDRIKKGAIYAQGGIADYWIVNLNDRKVEVYRDPVETANGWAYRIVQPYAEGETVTPLAQPRATIAVSDMLPKV